MSRVLLAEKGRGTSLRFKFFWMCKNFILWTNDSWKYLWFSKKVSSLRNVLLPVVCTNPVWKWREKRAFYLNFVHSGERESWDGSSGSENWNVALYEGSSDEWFQRPWAEMLACVVWEGQPGPLELSVAPGLLLSQSCCVRLKTLRCYWNLCVRSLLLRPFFVPYFKE